MGKTKCPICGDPAPFIFWIDERPPVACPYDDEEAQMSGPIKVHSVTSCPHQMGKARQRARWMKQSPECFDEQGNLKPGMLGTVLERDAVNGLPLYIG